MVDEVRTNCAATLRETTVAPNAQASSPDRTDVVAALARSTAADLLSNEVTEYRASRKDALKAQTKEVRGVKNDQRDAQHLSKASWQTDVPTVHIPSKAARELKSICGARDVLIGMRTKLINNVRGRMRTQLWRIRGGTTISFADRVRGHAESLGEMLPEHIERQLRTLSLVIEETKAADKQLRKLAGEHAVCRRLMTVPGIGPVTALRFVAAIDEPSRFASAHRVQSYLGLTPGEHSSSERERRTGITKAGSMELRRTLIQAAWVVMFIVRTPHPMIEWARRLAERRGRPVAAVALARKLAGILFAMWRDGSTYQSKLGAAAETSV